MDAAERARTEGRTKGEWDRDFSGPIDWLDYTTVASEMEEMSLDPTCWQEFAEGYRAGFTGEEGSACSAICSPCSARTRRATNALRSR